MKKFLIYTPFDNKKERILSYTTENTSTDNAKKLQELYISSLGATTNQNTNQKTWNDGTGGLDKAYISKVKLN